MKKITTFASFTLTGALVLGAGVQPAIAEELNIERQTAELVTAVAEEQGLPTGTLNGEGVTLSPEPDAAGALETPNGTLELGVRSTDDATLTADGLVFDVPGQDAAVVVQATEGGGVRALVNIDSPSAPERYVFPIGGDVASIEIDEVGGASALNEAGELVSYAPTPWAVDANGKAVPTHFVAVGTTLYQVVEHRSGDFAYGIVADPWWNPFSWPWGKWVKKSAPVVKAALKKCGVGALGGTLGLGVGTGTANVMIKMVGNGRAFIQVAGGPYGYLAAGVAGCVANQF